MAVNPAKENRITTNLVTALQFIVSGPNYASAVTPVIVVGSPGDPLPAGTTPHLYVQYVRTEARDASSGTATHQMRAWFLIWCISGDLVAGAMTAMLNLKADVLRALYAAETTFFTAYGYGLWIDENAFRDDFVAQGLYACAQVVFVEYAQDHTDT